MFGCGYEVESLLKLGLIKICRDTDVCLRFWCQCLIEILKLKFDQDLCKNLWYELSPRARCAFVDVLGSMSHPQGWVFVPVSKEKGVALPEGCDVVTFEPSVVDLHNPHAPCQMSHRTDVTPVVDEDSACPCCDKPCPWMTSALGPVYRNQWNEGWFETLPLYFQTQKYDGTVCLDYPTPFSSAIATVSQRGG